MLHSARGAGHSGLVCCSRQRSRTPAPGQGCWRTALGPVSHKGIHARLRPVLKSHVFVDCCLTRQKKKKPKKQRVLRFKIVVQSNLEMVIAKRQAEVPIFTSVDRGN